MMQDGSLIGFECLFAKKADVRDFFSFLAVTLENCYFWVADASVFSDRRSIEIPDRIDPLYLRELAQVAFVGERLILHLYTKEVEFREIDLYEDYLKSECEMIILLYDFYYLEIYCKDNKRLNKFMQKAADTPGAVVDAKAETTDGRTALYV